MTISKREMECVKKGVEIGVKEVLGKRCEKCIYWDKVKLNTKQADCRRYSPRLYSEKTVGGLWPITDWDEWCGEFRQKS